MNLKYILIVIGALVGLPAAAAEFERPLTLVPGDPDRGRAAILDRERGHCLLCHVIPALPDGFQGDIGPELSGIKGFYSAAELRHRIVDPLSLNPDTLMPSYYQWNHLNQVAEAYVGQPVLTAQEVEDVIAFLLTLDDAHD